MIENYLRHQTQKSDQDGLIDVESLHVYKIYLDEAFFLKTYNTTYATLELCIKDLVSAFYYAKINSDLFDKDLHICELKHVQPNMLYVEYRDSPEELIAVFCKYAIEFLKNSISGEDFNTVKRVFLNSIEVHINEFYLENLLVKKTHDNDKTKL